LGQYQKCFQNKLRIVKMPKDITSLRREILDGLPEEVKGIADRLSDAELEDVEDRGLISSWLLEIVILVTIVDLYKAQFERASHIAVSEVNTTFGHTKDFIFPTIDNVLERRIGVLGDLGTQMRNKVLGFTADAYRMGARSVGSPIKFPPATHISRLANITMYFLKHHYHDTLRKHVEYEIEGVTKDRVVTQQELYEAIQRGFVRMEPSFQRHATVAINMARSVGSIYAMHRQRVEAFEFVALPGCCVVCAELSGKVFTMSSALSTLDAIMYSDNPEDIKIISPFIHTLSELAGRGDQFILIPVHPNCRCYYRPIIL